MKALKITCYILVLIVLYSNSAFAWKTNKGNAVKMGTHERLTEYAVTNYTHLKRCPDQDDSNCDILKKIGLTFGLDEILTWGQKKEVWKWLILGADREDAGTLINMVTNSARFNNHFHNPLKDWESAGLSELIALPPFFLEGKSSLLWAQDSDYQSDPKWPEGDWTWEKTREYYYAALTGATDAERQAFFARMFKGLGHQAHLLQDKAVPAHVRNDAHPLPWHIEKWMADNPNVMRCLIEDHQTLDPSFVLDSCVQKDENGNIVLDESGNPVLKFKQVEVIKPEVLSMDTTDMILDPSYTSYYGTGRKLEKTSLLTDTDQYRVGDSPSASYSIGLAEYTNGNFFSPDTIFAETKDPDHRHFSPNPSRAITNLSELESNNIIPKTFVAEDGIPDGIKCIKKNAPGEEVDCLVRAGYLTDPSNNGESAIYERTFILDAPSHESYVKHLVPRAIGYSAALIDYFFRSKLEISPPDQYVYSIIDGGDIDLDDNTQYIRLLKAKVRNDTPDEEMLAGSLVAVTKYKKIIGYQPDLSSGSPTAEMREAEFSYSVSAPIEIASLSSTDPEEFTFDFLKPVVSIHYQLNWLKSKSRRRAMPNKTIKVINKIAIQTGYASPKGSILHQNRSKNPRSSTQAD